MFKVLQLVYVSIRGPRITRAHLSFLGSQAGSGEFHVYKQSRRREYERLKMMEDTAKAVRQTNERDTRGRIS